jgi:hypothetical protein
LLQWYHQTFLTLFDFSDKEVNIREYRKAFVIADISLLFLELLLELVLAA